MNQLATKKLSCWNVNGLRACWKKGFVEWLSRCNADVVALQETKIGFDDFARLMHEVGGVVHPAPDKHMSANTTLFDAPSDTTIWHCYLNPAQKPGYSGVALLCRTQPKSVAWGIGVDECDTEGRVLTAAFADFTFINTYIPNGGRELERIPFKLKFSDALLAYMQDLRKTQPHLVLCGDLNVAHTEIDIKNPKSNIKNSGFTPIEREWFTKFLAHKYIDSFRHLHPTARDAYTWWSYRPGVRERNVGWRIDYFVVTHEMIKHVKEATIEASQMGSDHCPVHLVVEK